MVLIQVILDRLLQIWLLLAVKPLRRYLRSGTSCLKVYGAEVSRQMPFGMDNRNSADAVFIDCFHGFEDRLERHHCHNTLSTKMELLQCFMGERG